MRSAQDTSNWVPRDWMKDWQLNAPKDITNSSRHKCFSEVAQKAEGLLLAEYSNLEQLRLPSPKIGSEPAEPIKPADWHNKLYRILCLKQMKRLTRVLNDLKYKNLVFAFDECSYLGMQKIPHGSEPLHKPPWFMSLIALLRIIKASDRFDDHDVTVWYLVMDTSSSVSDLAPSGRNAPSFRLTKELIFLPPWTYLGFNQMVDGAHREKIKKPIDALGVTHQKAYGRPVSSPGHFFPY
jgi:hypothetical protein